MAHVQTVLGPIPPEALGTTLPHEHFFCDSGAANFRLPNDLAERELSQRPVSLEIRGWLEQHWHRNRDNLVLDDEETAQREALRYRAAGGTSVVDVTPVGIGRDPEALVRVAEATGLNIIMGSGFYVHDTHPPLVEEAAEGELAELIARELREGVDETGIRPGTIGEIGCSWPLASCEAKILRAAAAAQTVSGAALYVHPGRHPDAPGEIVRILDAAGADLTRVVICHIERTLPNAADVAELARLGCYVELDLFGMETTSSYYRGLGVDLPSDPQRLDTMLALVEAGLEDRLLASHDICFKHRLATYGGHGYDHLLVTIRPWLADRGFPASAVRAIFEDNPRRLLTIA